MVKTGKEVRQRVLIFLCLCCAGYWVFVFTSKPPPLDVVADQVTQSLLFGDKTLAFDYLSLEEKTSNPISRAEFSAIVDRIIVSRWSKNRDFHRNRIWHMLYANAGGAGINEYTKFGLKRGFGPLVYKRKDHVFYLLSPLLIYSWRFEYFNQNDARDDEESRTLALYIGLQKDAPFLRANHLDYFEILNEDTGIISMRSLDEVKKQCLRFFASHHINASSIR